LDYLVGFESENIAQPVDPVSTVLARPDICVETFDNITDDEIEDFF
jgi:hypothetical protein